LGEIVIVIGLFSIARRGSRYRCDYRPIGSGRLIMSWGEFGTEPFPLGVYNIKVTVQTQL
jgi:hypothetical protein